MMKGKTVGDEKTNLLLDYLIILRDFFLQTPKIQIQENIHSSHSSSIVLRKNIMKSTELLIPRND